VLASGCETTLLQLLGTLDKLQFKWISIYIDGTILKLNDKDLSKFRNLNLGFIFQFHQLFTDFALENVCIPAFIAKKN
jgi:lipoprotein-releasing system ATP-binding protein